MNTRVVLLAALVAVAAAAPIEVAESTDQDAFAAFEEDARPKREQQIAQDRDDPYGPPPPYNPPVAYKPEPSYHKPVLPAQYKAFVKTDYNGNFKWGVKHNIEPVH